MLPLAAAPEAAPRRVARVVAHEAPNLLLATLAEQTLLLRAEPAATAPRRPAAVPASDAPNLLLATLAAAAPAPFTPAADPPAPPRRAAIVAAAATNLLTSTLAELLPPPPPTVDVEHQVRRRVSVPDAAATNLLTSTLAEPLPPPPPTVDVEHQVRRRASVFEPPAANLLPIQTHSCVLSPQHAAWLELLARAHGLIDPLTVSATERSDGTLVQTVAEAAGTVTLTTTAAPSGAAAPSALTTEQAAWLEALVRLHAGIDPLAVTATERGDGTLHQTLAVVGAVTTVTRTS